METMTIADLRGFVTAKVPADLPHVEQSNDIALIWLLLLAVQRDLGDIKKMLGN